MLHDKTISIIAGGWSLKHVDRSRIPGFRIGVNEAGLLERCDVLVSMDRLWTEARWARIVARAEPTWIRRSAMQNIRRDRPHNWLAIFECDNKSVEFTDGWSMLNGTNSGMVAFNLAWQLRPKTIMLWGFDMKLDPKNERYWYDAYPWAPKGGTASGKYRDWSRQFATARRQCDAAGIRVINVSIPSAITAFEKAAPEELLCPA